MLEAVIHLLFNNHSILMHLLVHIQLKDGESLTIIWLYLKIINHWSMSKKCFIFLEYHVSGFKWLFGESGDLSFAKGKNFEYFNTNFTVSNNLSAVPEYFAGIWTQTWK